MATQLPNFANGSMPLKAVIQLTGLNEHILRAWEKRYSAVKPNRQDNGRRIYSEDEVQKLQVLAQLTKMGHSIGNIAGLDIQQLRQLLDSHIQLKTKINLVELNESSLPEAFLQNALSHLGQYQLVELAKTLELARTTKTARDFALRIVAPLLAEVGYQVDQKKMGIAQEHALSATLRNQIAQLLESLKPFEKPGNPVVFVTQEGDLHEFGILLSNVITSARGLPGHYVGCNLPADEAANAVNRLGAKALVIGTSHVPADALSEPIEKYVRKIARAIPESSEIWIGGPKRVTAEASGITKTIRNFGSLEQLDQWLESNAKIQPS